VYGAFCASIFPDKRNNSVMWSMRLTGKLVMRAVTVVS
jgi:hypothetical protein